jgi:hypothetical protein
VTSPVRRRVAKARPQGGGDLVKGDRLVGESEVPLTGRVRRSHRADMHVGGIAHVDHIGPHRRGRPHAAGQHGGDDADGTGVVGVEHQPEDAGRVDYGQLEVLALAVDEVPGRPLEEGL